MMMELDVMLASEDRRALPLKPIKQSSFLFSDPARPAKHKLFLAEVERWSKGVWSSQLCLYPESLLKTRFPVPQKSEQPQIVAEIGAFDSITAEMANALVESIKRMKEGRSVLIAAAVTGKIADEEMRR